MSNRNMQCIYRIKVPKTHRVKTKMLIHKSMKIYREIKHSNKTTVAVTIAITGTLCPACKQTDK